MPKGAGWRITLIVAFIALSCIYLVPTLVPNLPAWWKGVLPKDKISLGLDLQGGTHLVLEVDTQKAIEGTLDLVATDLEDTLTEKNLRFKRISRTGSDKVSVVLYEKETAAQVLKLLKEKYRDYTINESVEEGGMVGVQLRMNEQDIQERKDKAVAQALETIRNRIDQFGVSEPVITRQGADQIVVQLPGIKDPQRAIELIGRTARLEFKLVLDDVSPTSGTIPEDAEVLVERIVDKATGAVTETPMVVKKKALITGDLLTDAQVRIDSQFNQPYVSIEFNALGARLFDQVTAANVNKRFAIVLDNTIYSAPVIRERISGGSAQISGNFTEKQLPTWP